jgi:hypothetical protein
MGFVQRAFTPGGGEAPEAVAQRAASQAKIDADAAAKAATALKPPTMPSAPAPPPQFQPGSAPGVKQRAAATASTLLGVGATTGQTAKKSLLG